MRVRRKLLVILLAIFMLSVAVRSFSQTSHRFGQTSDWWAVRYVDSVRGTAVCRVISKASTTRGTLTVEKSEAFFTTTITPPPKHIEWRLDDQEKQTVSSTRVLFLSFSRLWEARRLRVRAVTAIKNYDFDFDLTGLNKALKLLDRAECQ